MAVFDPYAILGAEIISFPGKKTNFKTKKTKSKSGLSKEARKAIYDAKIELKSDDLTTKYFIAEQAYVKAVINYHQHVINRLKTQLAGMKKNNAAADEIAGLNEEITNQMTFMTNVKNKTLQPTFATYDGIEQNAFRGTT